MKVGTLVLCRLLMRECKESQSAFAASPARLRPKIHNWTKH